MRLPVTSIGCVDFNFCGIVANPLSAVNFLTWLQSLIDLKEVLDFIELIGWNIREIF
jgi:hypothetical protein